MRLWLIRHPKPDVPEGTCYGRTDVPTDADHFDAVVARLRGLHGSADGPTPLRVITSPLSRCARVAHALAGDPWPAPEVDERIAEMHFGHWEGRPWGELPRHEIDAWRDDIAHWRPPGGETVTELADRGWAFLQSLAAEHAANAPAGREQPPIAVLTHAGIIMTVVKRVRGEPLSRFGGLRIDYGSVHGLAWEDGRWRVLSENL